MAASRASLIFITFAFLTTQVLGCDDGWTGHLGSCYIYMHETYNWFDAKSTCETMGGYLVEIQSLEENHFVAGLIHTNGDTHPWQGLNDFAEEGIFVFARDGERPTTYYWGGGEPGDSGHHEDCGGMNGAGQWLDATCDTDKRPFVCEMTSGSGGSIIG